MDSPQHKLTVTAAVVLVLVVIVAEFVVAVVDYFLESKPLYVGHSTNVVK